MFTLLCKFFHRLQKRPGWILLAAGVATFLGLFPLKEFRVHAAGSDLMPNEWESVRAWKSFGREFGSAGNLAVVVHSPYPKLNLEAVQRLAGHLESHPAVNFLEYRTEADFYRRHSLLYVSLSDLKEIRRRVETGFWINRTKRNPLILDLLSDEEKESAFDATSFEDLEAKYFSRLKDLIGSADSTILILRIYPNFDVTDIHACRSFYKDVQTAVAALPSVDSLEVVYTGDVFRNIENEGRLFSRVIITTRIALALSGLLLLLNFLRFPVGALLALIPVGMAAVWTMALTQLWLGPLGIVSAPLGLLLSGMGLSGAIHLLARYSEERRKRLSAPVAFETITLETGPAITAGLLTLAIAFLAFIATDFQVMGDFGRMAGIGMVCSLIAVLVVFPALLKWVEPYGFLHPLGPRLYNFVGHALESPSNFRNTSRGLLLTAAVLTGVLLFHGPQWRFQYDSEALGFLKNANKKADSLILAAGENLVSPAVFLTQTQGEAQAVAEELRNRAAQDGNTTAIGEVTTLMDLLPADAEQKLLITAQLRRTITPKVMDEAREPLRGNLIKLMQHWPTQPLTVADLPLNYRKKFLGHDETQGVFTYAFPKTDPKEGVNALRFADEVRSVTLPNGKISYAGGLPVVYGDLVRHMVPNAQKALSFGLLAIFLVLLLTVQSWRGALVLFLPVLFTGLWMLGSMKWMHLKLNPYNLIAFPVAIAYATIHSLHLYHRYEEEGYGSLFYVLRRTGRTALVTTVVGAAGFVPMVFAGHRGLASLGVMTVGGLAFGLMSTLLFIPGILGWWEAQRRRLSLTNPPPPT